MHPIGHTVCSYSAADHVKSLEGVELELQCACGHENFERVVVQRKPHPPIVTDFVACVGCKAMGQDMKAIGGPERREDSSEAM